VLTGNPASPTAPADVAEMMRLVTA